MGCLADDCTWGKGFRHRCIGPGLAGCELRRIYLTRLYEKVSSAGKAPHHEANHRSIYECFAARR